MSARLRPVAGLEIVPFEDAHLDDAAALLAARHARHREAEPLLPQDVDFRAELEKEWRQDGASGVFSGDGYLIGAASPFRGIWWLRIGIAGHAVEGDRERVRELYAAAAQRWVDEGHTMQVVFAPAHDAELVDAWFRLGFGGSAVLALRETGAEKPFEAGVEIRAGTPDDFAAAARLQRELSSALLEAPSFSDVPLQTLEEIEAEWREDDDADDYELFVAERDGRIVGHTLLYRRAPDLRVPPGSIDLAQGSTEPEARGTGVGRALTEHVLRWAAENKYPVMTTDWRITNLWASRFWPRRGFRTVFQRLYRSIA
jgi:GNAT superfamily N-acetyltransferase